MNARFRVYMVSMVVVRMVAGVVVVFKQALNQMQQLVRHIRQFMVKRAKEIHQQQPPCLAANGKLDRCLNLLHKGSICGRYEKYGRMDCAFEKKTLFSDKVLRHTTGHFRAMRPYRFSKPIRSEASK